MTDVRLSFPAPCRPWSTNERLHWTKRSERTSMWRTAAHIAARQARIGALHGRWDVEFTLPFERSGRRDPMNYYPPVKAGIDGLVDAGLWPDDTAQYVRVVEPLVEVTHSGLVGIRLTPCEAAP